MDGLIFLGAGWAVMLAILATGSYWRRWRDARAGIVRD